MIRQENNLYRLGPFRLDTVERRLQRDGNARPLPPKAFDLLVLLVQNHDRLVTKSELMDALWAETSVEEGNLSLNIHLVRKALGDQADDPQYIETVSKQGYRFIATVEKINPASFDEELLPATSSIEETVIPSSHQLSEARPTPEEDGFGEEAKSQHFSRPTDSKSVRGLFGGHFLHILTATILYALLFTVALFIEVAYQFDRYQPTAFVAAVVIFFWILGTSLAGLGAGWRLTRQGNRKGLYISLLSFIGAGLLLYVALGFYLPQIPITEAEFQTYPAHGAYLKSIYYFIPLAALFLIIPFHFVISLKRALEEGRHDFVTALLTDQKYGIAPRGFIYLKGWWLGLILCGSAVGSLIMSAHLFEQLKANEYKELFVQLVQWRFLLFLGLALECLWWYYHALNELRHETTLSLGDSINSPSKV